MYFFKQFYDEKPENKISINKLIYNDLLKDMADNKTLFKRLYQLDYHPFESYTQKYCNIISNYRECHHKAINDLSIKNPQQLVHRNIMNAFDEAIIHTLRNAVDHGIQDDLTRCQSTTDPGEISMELTVHDELIKLGVTDNGAGIDADLIYRKALKKNLIDKN